MFAQSGNVVGDRFFPDTVHIVPHLPLWCRALLGVFFREELDATGVVSRSQKSRGDRYDFTWEVLQECPRRHPLGFHSGFRGS